METNSAIEKPNFISIIKGVAIFLMLWGHCIQCCSLNRFDFFENSVFKFIYSFHMPLFMLVSGYLFYYSYKKRDLGDLLKHRLQGLLQPIIMYSIIDYYLTTGISSLYPPQLNALASGAWIENITSLWFLWSTLVSVTIVALTFKISKKLYVRCGIFFLGVIFAVLMPNAQSNIFMLPYFIIGFLFCKKKGRQNLEIKLEKLKYISIVLFPIMLIFYQKKHYIYTSGLYNPDYSILECIKIDIFRYLIGLVGSVFVIVIIEILYKLLEKNDLFHKIAMLFDKIGKDSLQYYCISVTILSAYLPRVFSIIATMLSIESIVDRTLLYNFIITPAITIVYIIIISIIIKIFRKLNIHTIIFGR